MRAGISCRPRRRNSCWHCWRIFCWDENVITSLVPGLSRPSTSRQPNLHDEWMNQTMKAEANGITINYRIDGPEGAPWLVFSNSLATSLAMWDEQTAALQDSFRVLRYDQRGHGGTDAPAGRYPFDTLLADALALMEMLAIGKANFAGLSMGGATALGLAERYPDRFERIIIADSP